MRSALLLFIVVLGILFTRPYIVSSWQGYVFEREMKAVEKCTRVTESVVTCARPHVQRLMSLRPASEIMDMFSDRFSNIRCHYVGHIVGQELYRQSESEELAFEQCGVSCESACMHGAVGEALMSSVGISEADVDGLIHIDEAQLLNIGRRMCDNDSCHGVGHAFFQAYDDFNPALKLCDTVADGAKRERCARGVFMEYSNVLASRSVWEDAPQEIDRASLYDMCTDLKPGVDKEACYYYLPGLLLGILQKQAGALTEREKIQTMLGICDSVLTKDKNLCINGVGVHFFSYLLMNSSEALNICESYEKKSEQAACAYGMLSLALETGDRERIFAYCTAFSESSVQRSCYQSIFHIAGRGKAENLSLRPYCVGSAACLSASTRALENPFNYINTTVH